MYGDYWNLRRLPFENGCDPRFFFRSQSHEAALLKLQYVVEQSKGVALLVGEHGIGKTYISRVLEAELEATPAEQRPQLTVAPIVRLMFPNLRADEMLGYLLNGLTDSADNDPMPAEERIRRLEAVLQKHAQNNRSPVFLIDDAHLIESPEVLQTLAQVSAFCEMRGLSLSILLAGQPNLLAQVQRVPALNSRATVRTALHPFSADETCEYIRHRLKIGGLDGGIFNDEALAAFHDLSLGFPRRINQLCDLALLVGYADELPSLGREEVEAAAEELLSVSID